MRSSWVPEALLAALQAPPAPRQELGDHETGHGPRGDHVSAPGSRRLAGLDSSPYRRSSRFLRFLVIVDTARSPAGGKAGSPPRAGQADLLAIRPVVAAVAALGQRILGRLPLEVDAGDVVEEQVILQREEFPEALDQVLFQGRLVRQQTIEGDDGHGAGPGPRV